MMGLFSVNATVPTPPPLITFLYPCCSRSALNVEERIPEAQKTKMFASVLGQVVPIWDKSHPSGRLIDPSIWPVANSEGDLTSIRIQSLGIFLFILGRKGDNKIFRRFIRSL